MTTADVPTERSDQLAAAVPEFEAVSPDQAAAGPSIVQDINADPKVEPYDAQQNLDNVRSKLAFRLIWILVGVLAVGAVLLVTAPLTGVDKVANVATTALTVFTSIVTLVSAATGFYFGQSQPGK